MNMNRTTSDSNNVEDDPNSAKYYMGKDQTETPFPKNSLSAPIGYLYSTANDLGKYLAFHLTENPTILRQI